MNNLHEIRIKKLETAINSANQYGLRVMYIHFSALSPSTRKSHAKRHGKLFTGQEMLDFWSNPENAKDCKCSFAQIMIDESGKPFNSTIQKRALSAYQKMKKRGYDWSK